MKYFVTGGAGFIGSNLSKRLLDSGHSVTVYDNLSNGSLSFLDNHINNKRLKIFTGDTLDPVLLTQAMAGHDFVVHLAANADIAASANSTDLDLNQTVLATYNVLESMRSLKITRLIYSSGSGVYGDIGSYAPSEEYGPLLPVSMYGATKLCAEALISAFSSLFGIQAFIFRFANIIGPNQTHGVAYDFIRKLRSSPKELMVLGNGLQSKSYIHVDDVISAILTIASNVEASISQYNVGTGDYLNVREIAEMVVEEMGLSNVNILYQDSPYGWKGDVPVVRLNDEKLRALGWSNKFSSSEAMRLSIKQMLS